MSDFPEGPEWWKATDGCWYAPPTTDDRGPPQGSDAGANEVAGASDTVFNIGCLFVILLMIVVGGAIVIKYALDTGGDSETECDAAWKKAASVSSFEDTPKDYRRTFIECNSIAEWEAADQEHGSRIPTGAFTIANYCHELNVESPLCREALSKTPSPP